MTNHFQYLLTNLDPVTREYLNRHPVDMSKFLATGHKPLLVKPTSPLIDLLETMTPRERIALGPVTLNPKLGYECSIQFRNCELLLRWLKPDKVVKHCPAESYRNKRFSEKLTREALIE